MSNERTTISLGTPLPLASGSVIPNRLAKAAMEEQLAGSGRLPDHRLVELYRRWGMGGAGLLITGHVMVDRRAMAQPGDVVLDQSSSLRPFTEWAQAAKQGKTQIWMQINHPGRVVQADTRGLAWAPSATPIQAGYVSRMFSTPVAISEAQIQEVIERFATTAQRAEAAGFDGVEVHSAHGYLLSQFLSPLVNRRTDMWGGSLENRARLLLEVVRAIRSVLRKDFAVAVKLNSADFQRGGFEIHDAERVIQWLAGVGVDLVELSGGSIESLATSGSTSDGRTLEREAYFLKMAKQLIESAPLPLMLTGGIRRRTIAQHVLDAGFALVGSATALAVSPEAPRAWLAGQEHPVVPPEIRFVSKTIRAAAIQAAVTLRMEKIALGKSIRNKDYPPIALVLDRYKRAKQLRAYLIEQSQ